MTAPAPVSPAVDRWPLVGRHVDLDRCRRVLADPGYQAVVVHGPPGVGKTRLAEECATAAAAAGHPVARCVATAAASTVPLGALAHLLPVGTDRDDPVSAFHAAATALRARGPRRTVLLVDDLPLLDTTSVVLVGQLLDAGVLVLLATARDGQTPSDAASALERGDRVHRVDLGDLDRGLTETLLHLALGSPVERRTAQDLYEASRGNVLFLRELVREALRAGTLAHDGLAYRLSGPLAPSRRLVDVVETALGGVGPTARRALELVALCAPLGLADLEAVAGPGGQAVLEELEGAGLLDVRTDGGRTTVALAHPLFAESLRGQLPVLRRRGLLLEQAARVSGRGQRRREDPLRVATWQLDAGVAADPALLLRAARLARHANDFPQVATLARAALPGDPTVRPRLLLAEALFELGDPSGAEQVLADATGLERDDEERVLLALQRTQVLFWGRGDARGAFAVHERTRPRLTEPAARLAIDVDEAVLQAIVLGPGSGLPVLERLDAVADPRTRVMGTVGRSYALAELGRTDEAVAVVQRARGDLASLREPLVLMHPSTQVQAEVAALDTAGHLERCRELALPAHARAVADRAPIPQLWLTLELGRNALLSGQPQTARGWLGDCDALARRLRFTLLQQLVLAQLAIAHALLGDLAAADAALTRLAPAASQTPRADAAQAQAWRWAADGRLSEARALLLQAADGAARAGRVSTEARLLGDVARLGDAAAARTRLEELARLCDGPYVPGLALLSAGLAADDPQVLAAACDGFEAMGAVLLAAEAAAAAGQAARRRQDQRRATALLGRSAALAGRCQGARTPMLAGAASPEPLTSREREIALLAARGSTSKEIAAGLVLSARTVDNHLARVYAKLGVTGRSALAEALGEAGDRS